MIIKLLQRSRKVADSRQSEREREGEREGGGRCDALMA
jgi:hypothetical protein